MSMITLEDIRQAQSAISPYICRTSLELSSTLSSQIGTEVYLKMENLQKTGSFKVRGAMNKILSLSDGERRRGVIAASAGNHAQGVAMASSLLGIPSTIVMPENAPLTKITATESYGAQVVLSGRVFDDSYEKALEIQQETGAVFIHAFDDPAIMAGQGTIGLEIYEELPDVDTVLIPIGGGGLIAGVAVALKSLKPSVRIIGVQAAGAAGMIHARKMGKPESLPHADTLADGIAVKRVGDLTFATAERYVDELVTVEEEEISQAILTLMEKTKTLTEGAGAVGLAAALQGKVDLTGQKAVFIISGGNMDINFLAQIIERGLRRSGRAMTCQLLLPDQPGNLEKVLELIAQEGGNIINIEHSRYDLSVPLRYARVHMTLETKGFDHQERIMKGLEKAGYSLVQEGI